MYKFLKLNSFTWPRIVSCDQFPLDNNMCISAQVQQKQSNRKKSQDNNQLKAEQILNQYCQSDWVCTSID